MISKLRKIIAVIIDSLGLFGLLKYLNRQRLFLIGYHSVSAKLSDANYPYHDLIIDEQSFKSQIDTLIRDGHTFIDPDDLDKLDVGSVFLPTIIYFDDAYRDLLDFAIPVLKERKIKPIIFVPTDLVEGKRSMWTHAERYYLRKKGFTIEKIEEHIKNLKSLSHEERNILLQSTGNMEGLDFYLSWNEIKELYNSRLAIIGSHGVTHVRLNELSLAEIRREVSDSKRLIEQRVGNEVSFFSFPGGRTVKGVENYLEEAGYKFAVRTVSGTNSLPINLLNRFQLSKIAPKPNESSVIFRARLYLSFLFK